MISSVLTFDDVNGIVSALLFIFDSVFEWRPISIADDAVVFLIDAYLQCKSFQVMLILRFLNTTSEMVLAVFVNLSENGTKKLNFLARK